MTINWKYGAEEADGATERHEREKTEKSESTFGVIAQSLSYIFSNV